MKTNFTFWASLFGMLFFCHFINAQADCITPQAQADLDANNVRARLKNAGDLWWDGSDARYIVPKVEPGQGPEVAAIFAGGLWFGGFDPAGNLRLAAPTYGSAQSDGDYFAGPLDDQGQTSEENCQNFDKIWETTSGDIQAHHQDWTDNGVIDGPVPASILGWPGRGNPYFFNENFFDLPDQDLAPFIDINNDGVYDPYDGDYPNINDADQARWMVFNDAGNLHTESGGAIIGLEVHLLAYAYQSASDAINDATFYEYSFINKSGVTLDSVFATLWVDADLGCYTDDYIGCSPERDLAYVYNMDEIDGNSSCNCQGVATYCEEIPVVGIKMLNGVLAGRVFGPDGNLETPAPGQAPDTLVDLGMSSFMYYRNASGSPTPPPATTDPGAPVEYYNLMSGSWRDGVPLTRDGNGYDPASTNYTSYAYDGNPSIETEWSMCSVEAPASDPRMVISSGPFRMESGAVNRMAFTVLFKADVAHPCPDISVLEEVADEVHFFYDGTIFTNTSEIPVFEQFTSLSPNPFSQETILSSDDPEVIFSEVKLYTLEGRLGRSYSGVNANQLHIEKGSLAAGMYFYQVVDQDNRISSGKFVVQ